MSGHSGRDEEFRAWSDGDELDMDQHFAQLMAQLEACGCGPASGTAGAGTRRSAFDDGGPLPPACGPVIENIAQMLDHVMPSELERMMREHSENCEQCGPAVDAEMRLRELVRRSCSEHAPESLRVRITTLTAEFHS